MLHLCFKSSAGHLGRAVSHRCMCNSFRSVTRSVPGELSVGVIVLSDDRSVVVVLTSEDADFCAGVDITGTLLLSPLLSFLKGVVSF